MLTYAIYYSFLGSISFPIGIRPITDMELTHYYSKKINETTNLRARLLPTMLTNPLTTKSYHAYVRIYSLYHIKSSDRLKPTER